MPSRIGSRNAGSARRLATSTGNPVIRQARNASSRRPMFSNNLSDWQSTAGKAAGIVGGVTGLFGQVSSMMSEADQIQTEAPVSQVDQFGQPVYNLGGFMNQTNSIKPEGSSFGELLSGGLEGAAGGAAFGPLGAGIGFGVGLITSAIGGGARKREMEQNKLIAEANLREAQRNYNNLVNSSTMRRQAMGAYNDMLNVDARMNNLYTFNA